MWWYIPLNPTPRKQSKGDLSHSYLQSEFHNSQGYEEKPFLERVDKTNKKSSEEKDK